MANGERGNKAQLKFAAEVLIETAMTSRMRHARKVGTAPGAM